jgi:hypothetical protein
MITLTPCPAGATPLRPGTAHIAISQARSPRPAGGTKAYRPRMLTPVPPSRDSRATSSLRIDQQPATTSALYQVLHF